MEYIYNNLFLTASDDPPFLSWPKLHMTYTWQVFFFQNEERQSNFLAEQNYLKSNACLINEKILISMKHIFSTTYIALKQFKTYKLLSWKHTLLSFPQYWILHKESQVQWPVHILKQAKSGIHSYVFICHELHVMMLTMSMFL